MLNKLLSYLTILSCVLSFSTSIAMAAGSCVLTEPPNDNGRVITISWAWTSDSSGDVNDSSCTSGFTNDRHLLYCITNPDDTAAPTDNYIIDMNDSNGADMAGMTGRDTANTEIATPLIGGAFREPYIRGPLSLVASGAGDTKQGVATCVFERRVR